MALNQEPPFINPLVPFSCMVKGGLHDGMIITVCGRVWPNADRFNVNLQHGADDVILHVNPRYQTYLLGVGSVVHNTLQKGTWGSVERKFENPFPKGEMFSLQILVTKDSYKILANGKLFSEYKHRMPFLDVDRICVVGMVELSLVTFHYLGHLNFFIPRVKEAGKKIWARELEEMRRNAEAEESNKDALSYLQAGLGNILVSNEQDSADRAADESITMKKTVYNEN